MHESVEQIDEAMDVLTATALRGKVSNDETALARHQYTRVVVEEQQGIEAAVKARDGDPAGRAAYLWSAYGAPLSWAQEIIWQCALAALGNPREAAWHVYCHNRSLEAWRWRKQVAWCFDKHAAPFPRSLVVQWHATLELIERKDDLAVPEIGRLVSAGVPPSRARNALRKCLNSMLGNPAGEAQLMARNGDATDEWAREFIEDCAEARCGDPVAAMRAWVEEPRHWRNAGENVHTIPESWLGEVEAIWEKSCTS